MSGNLVGELILWLIVAIVAIVIGVYIVNWLYHRSSKEVSFVRTGFLGERVVINGGAFVLPFIHDYTPVNMNVLPMGIVRSRQDAVITRDRMRVDIGIRHESLRAAWVEGLEAALALGDLASADEILAKIVDLPRGLVPPWNTTISPSRAVAARTASNHRIRSWPSDSVKSILTPTAPQDFQRASFSRCSSSVSTCCQCDHSQTPTPRSAA